MPPPRLFLVLTNISKKPNLVILLRCCCLYSIPVVVVGAPKLFEAVWAHLPSTVKDLCFFKDSDLQSFADLDFYVFCPNTFPPSLPSPSSPSSSSTLPPPPSPEEYGEKFVKLQNVNELLTVLNGGSPVSILGIEIPSSTTQKITPLDELPPILTSTALMLGNEGAGMSPKQVSVCDEFVYIKQYR